jgi:hypothetical protein
MTKLPTLEREGETLYFLFEPRPRHPSNAITIHVMCDRRTNYEPGATAAAIQRAVNTHDDLLSALKAALEWIDAVPPETVLPTMPGFDRDDVNALLDNLKAAS